MFPDVSDSPEIPIGQPFRLSQELSIEGSQSLLCHDMRVWKRALARLHLYLATHHHVQLALTFKAHLEGILADLQERILLITWLIVAIENAMPRLSGGANLLMSKNISGSPSSLNKETIRIRTNKCGLYSFPSSSENSRNDHATDSAQRKFAWGDREYSGESEASRY